MDRLLELTCRAEQSHFWFRGFRRFVRPILDEAARSTRDGARLLDCGCGTGANLALLGDFGDAYGFDVTWQGLRLAHSLGRRRVARASIAAIPFPSAHFHIATSFDVFQCLPDAVEDDALREMRRVLEPGGHLVMTVAALEILRGSHAALSQEVRRYSKPRLRELLEEAGFRIERLTFANTSLLPIMLPLRLLQRWSSNGAPSAGELEITVPARPINAVLSGLLALESAALRHVDMPFGSSLLCHARRID
ncbi:MAG: class I SAM-dependent methyltransferase [Vicinamibacterales bacterium]